MELEFLSLLAEEARQSKSPVWGQFELTPVCNLNCHMCYVHRSEEDRRASARLLPASFWLDTARQAMEQGMLVLSLTGGETLTYPDLDELMDGLLSMGLLISFNTNGTLVDEKRVEWFLRHPPTKINISLYGASDETYAKLCGMKNGYTRVTAAIERLQAVGLNVYLNAVLVPENVRDLPKMHAYAAEHGLELHTTSYIFPPRGCAGCGAERLHRLDPEQAAEANYFDMMITSGRPLSKRAAATAAYELDQMEAAGDWKPEFRQCRAGICSFAVNWMGEMQPCVMFHAIRESLHEQSFAQCWENIVRRVEEIPGPAECRQCRKQAFCPVCKAAVYQETGSHDKAPGYLCAYTEHMALIFRKEGNGSEILLSDCGDFRAGGCSD